MRTIAIATVSVLIGAYFNHFLSTVRFRMQLQADLLKEVSTYLASSLITVVVQQDIERAQKAYADSTAAGEELLVRVGTIFPPSVHALMKDALRGIAPVAMPAPGELLEIVRKYREATRCVLRAMEDSFTAWGRLRGWWESPRVVRAVGLLRSTLQRLPPGSQRS